MCGTLPPECVAHAHPPGCVTRRPAAPRPQQTPAASVEAPCPCRLRFEEPPCRAGQPPVWIPAQSKSQPALSAIQGSACFKRNPRFSLLQAQSKGQPALSAIPGSACFKRNSRFRVPPA
eukprot:183404-Chlamydomonas_euryale.AAC.1